MLRHGINGRQCSHVDRDSLSGSTDFRVLAKREKIRPGILACHVPVFVCVMTWYLIGSHLRSGRFTVFTILHVRPGLHVLTQKFVLVYFCPSPSPFHKDCTDTREQCRLQAPPLIKTPTKISFRLGNQLFNRKENTRQPVDRPRDL